MKVFALTMFILITCSRNVNAQYDYLGFAGDSYYTINKSDNKLLKINKFIYIVYNQFYCSLYIDGRGSVFFPISGFRVDSNATESFISDETDVTEFGHYDVMIERKKVGNTVTINLPTIGAAYIIDKAKVYSANGEVKGNLDIQYKKRMITKPLMVAKTAKTPDQIALDYEEQYRKNREDKRVHDSLLLQSQLNAKRIDDSILLSKIPKNRY